MKLKNTSASQVKAWSECPRLWHFNWVRGFKEPPSSAMQRGTYIHAAAEHLIKEGVPPRDEEGNTTEWGRYAVSMAEWMPVGQTKVLVEHEFWLNTAPGLPPWLGYIDLLDDSRVYSDFMRITDHKTTSDFRYAKTPEELRNDDSQLNAYARFAFENGLDEDKVEVGHLYVKTSKKTPKKPKVLPVYAEVSREKVQKNWERDLVRVEDMVRAAEIGDTDLLDPLGIETGRCKKYGGCPHRSRCGLSPVATPFKKKKTDPLDLFEALKNDTSNTSNTSNTSSTRDTNNGKDDSMDFLAELEKAKQEATTEGVEATEGESENEGYEGVLSSDAAPREVEEKTGKVAEETEQDTKNKTKNKPKTTKSSRKTQKKKSNGRASFALYIDCMPQKNPELDIEPTLFEDWLSPVLENLNTTVAEKKNLPDYRCLPYAEEKAAFSSAIQEQIKKNMPPAMVVMSSSPRAKEALEVFIPLSTSLVRGLRG